jgi:hypothetical protein
MTNDDINTMLHGKRLGFGSLKLPRIEQSSKINYEMLEKMVDAFLDFGFKYFEVAYAYANEDVFKKCLVERHKRDLFLLANKLPLRGITSKKHCHEVFNESLEKCGTDYFDFYMLHCVTLELYKPIQGFCFDFLAELKQRGYAKKVGFSFHDNAEVMENILSMHHKEIDFVQLQINYLDWESPVIQSRQCYETVRKYDLPVFVMVPAKGGLLAALPPAAVDVINSVSPDCTPVSWAYRFAASLDGVELILTGMDNIEQTNDNVSRMIDFVPFSDAEYQAVNSVIDIIQNNMKVQCTSCGYCISECPKKIPIPTLINWYNNFRASVMNYYYYYYRICEGKGQAKDCTKCKLCEASCPQKINIHECMNDISKIVKSNFTFRLEAVIKGLRKFGLLSVVYRAAKRMQGIFIQR